MKTKTKVIISLVVVAGAVGLGRFTAPSKVVEKEKIVFQEKIVTKKVYIKDTSKKVNKVTIRLVTIKPDGTRTIETKIFDKSEIEITQKGESIKSDDIKQTTEKEKTTEYKHDDLLISFGAKVDPFNATTGLSYGLFLNKRLLGPFYMGIFGFTDRSVGASLGLSF